MRNSIQMPRQPRLRPKTNIPGFPDSWYDFAAVAHLSELEYHQGLIDNKPEQRVFRVKRKHVLKACDRCRVKKTKCDGKQPCNRCSTYNHPCLFREKKATQTKVYSRGFVEMLESHHSLVVKALQQLYKHCVNKDGFPGEPLAEGADGYPLTHAILDRLGLIKQAEEKADDPDEESEDLQYLRHLSTSTECSATTDPSPEPITPPEPCSSNCSPIEGPLAAGDFKWDMQFPALQGTNTTSSAATQPGQYDFAEQASYHHHHHHGMMMSRGSLNLGGDMSSGAVSSDVPTSASASASASYLYYNNGEDNHLHHSPPMMPGLDPHHSVAHGLPLDAMFNEYALHGGQHQGGPQQGPGQQQQQQQQQGLFATSTTLAPGWTFPA